MKFTGSSKSIAEKMPSTHMRPEQRQLVKQEPGGSPCSDLGEVSVTGDLPGQGHQGSSGKRSQALTPEQALAIFRAKPSNEPETDADAFGTKELSEKYGVSSKTVSLTPTFMSCLC